MATIPRPTTPTKLRDMCALSICDDYDNDRLARLLAEPDALSALLSIPRRDAIYYLVGAMPPALRAEWSQACERRAAEYGGDPCLGGSVVYASYISDANYSANYAAAAAARAATRAGLDANDIFAARDSEYQIAIRHAVLLLGW